MRYNYCLDIINIDSSEFDDFKDISISIQPLIKPGLKRISN